MTMPFYLSRRRVNASEWTLSATISGNNQVMTLSSGWFYNDSSTATESLATALDNALEAAYSAYNFTVTYSITTGKFTFTISGLGTGTWAINANQTSLYEWLGGTTNLLFGLTASTSWTLTNVAQGAIFAGSGRGKYTGITRKMTGATVVADSGVTAHIGSGRESVRRSGAWVHQFEPYETVASPLASGVEDVDDSVAPWTWKDFWTHHAEFGEPFRFYANRDGSISSHEDDYVYTAAAYAAFAPERVEDGADTYWRVPVAVDRYLVSS